MKDINEQLAGQLGRTVHLDTDRFRGTYFDVIMPLNMSAVMAAYDAADAIEETGMFRQSVKREVKKLVKMLDIYNLRLRETYETRYDLYSDYLSLFGEKIGNDIDKYKNGIVLLIGRLGQREHIQEKALVLLAAHLSENAAELHRRYIVYSQAVGVPPVMIDSVYYGTMKPVAMQLQKIAGLLIPFTKEQMDAYTEDTLHETAIRTINKNCLSNGDLDYRMLAGLAADALDLNKERYGEEAERSRAELNRLDKQKEDAVKAALQKIEENKKDNLAEQLSEKFKVTRKK